MEPCHEEPQEWARAAEVDIGLGKGRVLLEPFDGDEATVRAGLSAKLSVRRSRLIVKGRYRGAALTLSKRLHMLDEGMGRAPGRAVDKPGRQSLVLIGDGFHHTDHGCEPDTARKQHNRTLRVGRQMEVPGGGGALEHRSDLGLVMEELRCRARSLALDADSVVVVVGLLISTHN